MLCKLTVTGVSRCTEGASSRRHLALHGPRVSYISAEPRGAAPAAAGAIEGLTEDGRLGLGANGLSGFLEL